MVGTTAIKRRLSEVNENEEHQGNKMAKIDDSKEELSRNERQERVYKNMRLRRIIKENHGTDVNQLGFFFNNKNFSAPVGIDVRKTFDKRGSVQREQTDTSNVLATIGGCQVFKRIN